MFSEKFAVCSVQCAARSVEFVVCSVQREVCNLYVYKVWVMVGSRLGWKPSMKEVAGEGEGAGLAHSGILQFGKEKKRIFSSPIPLTPIPPKSSYCCYLQ